MIQRGSVALGVLVLPWLLAGCDEGPPNGVLMVTAASADGTPLAGALSAIEEGGLLLPNSDPTVGTPSYQYGAQAGIEPTPEDELPPVPGAFTILLPRGPKGVHIFADGFFVTFAEVTIAPKETEFVALDLRAAPLGEGALRPTMSNVLLSPSAVGPGAEFTLSVDVVAAEGDPLSDRVLVIKPDEGYSAALAPPPPPEDDPEAVGGPADGTWSTTLIAPTALGAHTYHLVAASQNGVTAVPLEATLIVE